MVNLKKQGIMGALAGLLISVPSLYGVEGNEDLDQRKRSPQVRVNPSQEPQEVLIDEISYKDRLLKCLHAYGYGYGPSYKDRLLKLLNAYGPSKVELSLLRDLSFIAKKYAEAGDEKAMLTMAFTSDYSMKTPPKYWVEKLQERAEAGSIIAQRSLGDIFFHLSPFLDREKGRLYYKMAAAQGDKEAQRTLDMINRLGYGDLGACEEKDVFLVCAR